MTAGSPDNPAEPIPLEAFFGEHDRTNPVTADLVRQADVIIGVDVMSHQEYVIFGKPALKRISETGQPEDLHVLRVAIDAATEDIDKLCGLVMALRGRYDFGSDWEERQ